MRQGCTHIPTCNFDVPPFESLIDGSHQELVHLRQFMVQHQRKSEDLHCMFPVNLTFLQSSHVSGDAVLSECSGSRFLFPGADVVDDLRSWWLYSIYSACLCLATLNDFLACHGCRQSCLSCHLEDWRSQHAAQTACHQPSRGLWLFIASV